MRRALRSITAVALTGLLVAGLFVTVSAINPGTAHARCVNGQQVTSDYWLGGVRRAYERPQDGTCDGDSYYGAFLFDGIEDGNCAMVQFEDGGNPWAEAQRTCRPAHQAEPYGWHDVNNSSRAYMRLCVYGGYGTFCGFGREPVDARGLNAGF